MLRSLDQIENQALKSGHVASCIAKLFQGHVAVRGDHGCRCIDNNENCEAKLNQIKRSLLDATMGVAAI